MKTPIFNLHKLSGAELGQFSVMLSSVLTPKQAVRLASMLPSLEAIMPQSLSYEIEGVPVCASSLLRAKTFCEGGQYIQSLKELRQYTGGSLKATKDFVDKMVADGKWSKPPPAWQTSRA